jgi:hypothetical protein
MNRQSSGDAFHTTLERIKHRGSERKKDGIIKFKLIRDPRLKKCKDSTENGKA